MPFTPSAVELIVPELMAVLPLPNRKMPAEFAPTVMVPLLVTVLLLPLTWTPNPLAPTVIAPAFVTVLPFARLTALRLSPSVIDAPCWMVTVTLFCVPLPTPVVSVPVQVTVAPLETAAPLG
jgi:hypothetical protein